MTEKTYKLDEPMVVRTKNLESRRTDIERSVALALEDLKNRIIDPTTESVVLTAVIKGGDDSVSVADLCLDHKPTSEQDSRMNYTVASWKHQVPESVAVVYDELAQNLGMYIDDLSEPDDNYETTGVAVGDPSNQLVFSTGSQPTSNLFADVEEGTDLEESDDSAEVDSDEDD